MKTKNVRYESYTSMTAALALYGKNSMIPDQMLGRLLAQANEAMARYEGAMIAMMESNPERAMTFEVNN
jgi:hypothetical protein